jgi:ATP-dependent Clp protease ATP-binding subunit ClpC
MDWLTLMLIVAAAGGVVFALSRSGARRVPAAALAPQAEPPPPPPAGSAQPPSLQELATRLQPFYDSTSHPQDLEANAEFQEGVARFADPRTPLEQVVNACVGANMYLAAMAAAALALRDDSAPAIARVISHLRFANVWTVYYIFRFLDARVDRPVICAALLDAPEWWADNPLMPQLASEFVDARAANGEQPDVRAELEAKPREDLRHFEGFLAKLTTPVAARIGEQLAAWRRTRVDRRYLASIGRVWEGDPDGSPIIEHAGLAQGVPLALEAIMQTPPSSFVLVGEPGVGKTALFRLVARRLMASGWTVFEASAAEILAGQVYIGELEERMRRLLEQLDVGRRVLWYVPNLHELAYAGRHRYSPVGVLDLVMPAVEAGRLCVVGELEPASLEKALQQRPRMRVAFKSLVLESLAPAAALEVAGALVEREFAPAGLAVEPAVLQEALELARHYLATRALPGSLVDLLRHTKARLANAGSAALTRDDLFATLTELTGLPRSVVDDHTGLDPAGLRAHFEARVMGQPEAVSCLVDRIAMLKAGLTDPNRPIGVFLFAGPTGTGKTEVARTLAEFLFGSADRMIRLDMSEFQEPASLGRILGESGDGEMNALVNRIRKQPFSVVLLDEFEKANPRVWDLFLQVFDHGRLTDALGGLADFRHGIIILTSNIGATAHQGSSLGFAHGDAAFSAAQVARAIANTFRPEFVNRIDRVVVFRPLARAVMRDILRKELRDVLTRRGFRTRDWAVEWEESAIEFLLDRGFTPDMGARPLRRAIETHVLAPIAMTIVENRFPEGDQFLFVRSDGNAIQVEFVDPDAPAVPVAEAEPEPPARGEAIALGRMILAPAGNEAERRFLQAQVDALDARLHGEAWIARKDGLLREVNRPGFWEEPGRYALLDEVERMDRIEAGADTARALMLRIENRVQRRGGVPQSIVSNLAHQLYLITAALADLDDGRPSDAFLLLEAVAGEGRGAADGEWTRTLAGMYREWAKKRRMRAAVLCDGDGRPFVMAVNGFGAHRILAREAGLHVLEVPGGGGGFERHTARVRVAAQPVTPRPPQKADLDHALACLAAAGAGSNAVVRRYRERPSPLVRDAVAGWRTGRLGQVLGGEFDILE